jgi:hypothetical protein
MIFYLNEITCYLLVLLLLLLSEATAGKQNRQATVCNHQAMVVQNTISNHHKSLSKSIVALAVLLRCYLRPAQTKGAGVESSLKNS